MAGNKLGEALIVSVSLNSMPFYFTFMENEIMGAKTL